MKRASRGGGLAIVIMVALAVAGCTVQSTPTESHNSRGVQGNCASSALVVNDGPYGQEIEGSSEDGLTLFGQIQAHKFLVASETVKKVVWRVGGSGDLKVRLLGPDGDESALIWGPEHHSSSNYERPGDEYGTGLVLDQTGCWRIEFSRGSDIANVWLIVGAG